MLNLVKQTPKRSGGFFKSISKANVTTSSFEKISHDFKLYGEDYIGNDNYLRDLDSKLNKTIDDIILRLDALIRLSPACTRCNIIVNPSCFAKAQIGADNAIVCKWDTLYIQELDITVGTYYKNSNTEETFTLMFEIQFL